MELLALREQAHQSTADCKEFRDTFMRLEQLVQFAANAEYAGLLDGIACHLLQNGRFVLRLSKLEADLEERFLARATIENLYAEKRELEAVKREYQGSFNNLKQRVQDMTRESKELEHSFSNMRSAVDMSATVDQFADIANKLKDFTPLYRTAKVEAALDHYLPADAFQKYKEYLSTELHELRETLKLCHMRDEFEEEK